MGRGSLYMLRHLLTRLYRCQDGSGTVISMFGLIVCLMLGGIAIDSTNAWRSKGLLNLTADVAAHAGVVSLAQGAEPAIVLSAAKAATEFNMPYDYFGRIIEDASYDIALRHYNSETNTVGLLGEPNAVVITLQRSKAVSNPLPTYLLGFVGQQSWDIKVRSVAAIATTKRCDSTEGIFAREQVMLTSQNQIGTDYCIHSQQAVALPAHNTFEEGSLVSMPNLAKCQHKCGDTAISGVRAQAVNLIMPDLGTFIQDMNDAFTSDMQVTQQVRTFFETRPLDDDVSALDEIGVQKSVLEELENGTAVSLTELQFSRMREYPEGLTYNVSCSDRGRRRETVLKIGDAPYSPTMKNIVVATNCEIHFGENADVRGSLIITTREQRATTLTADAQASAGDPRQACDPKQHSVIMSLGKLKVPASFASSNVTFVVGDAAQLTGTPNVRRSAHRGMSIHATGKVQVTGEHNFQTCNNTPDALAPILRVIRHVTPSSAIRG